MSTIEEEQGKVFVEGVVGCQGIGTGRGESRIKGDLLRLDWNRKNRKVGRKWRMQEDGNLREERREGERL